MRTIYEQEHNRLDETNVVPVLEEHLKGQAIKLPPLYFADFAMVGNDGNILSFVEFKKRNMKFGQYPTIMLSSSKWLRLKSVELLRQRALFVVQCIDGVWAVDLTRPDLKFDLVYGGRTKQTRDNADVEPCLMIPISQFRLLHSHDK
mgnify:CR=1 FL=1|tara:strand:- start:960 stop:1400 length:441 start_codon:yes stop_codon:yes gene_type:complete